MERRRAKIRRIRRAIRIATCLLTLAIVVLGVKAVSKLVMPKGKSVQARSKNVETSDNKAAEESKTSVKKGSFKVCIDAGHGGKDGGSSYDGRDEKDDVLKLALKVKSELEKKGITVVMTREKDTFLELEERCKVSNDAGVDYFVSLHRNKGKGSGVETWISSTQSNSSKNLADNIMDQLETAGIQENRGVKSGTQADESKDYFVNANVKAPSCILELGFMDNSKDNNLFDKNIDVYAKAIAEGIYKSGDIQESDKQVSTNTEVINAEDSAQASAMGQVNVENEQIADIENMDAAPHDWGPGPDADENNRPVSAVSYQEKYGKYSADFIKPTDEGDGKKRIYLTFDEGYENGFTGQILDVLKEKECPAVFFVTKPYVEGNDKLVQRMIDEGHIVGNHSVTHPSKGLPSQSLEQQKSEVTQVHDYMLEKFNYKMFLFRYPTGRFSEQSLALVNNLNYRSVFWSFAHYDYDVNKQPDEAKTLEKLKKSLHPGGIYLLHAVSQTNTNILGQFIDEARAQGFEFAKYTVQ
ncbi:chitooligosaccharide deacetylase [Anaerosacchariphilus polymeriproducens]|uniref:Chitooligosaccharide deacetylase n=1 Tax=Anaerosacchariphilus polymeriproducens TaxID=1812858 RepID=A0A371ATH5_9FIRM|nr:chitooligosaccharide deacetylase [Anaerosacchariphilus polymeriproducens]